MKAVIIAGGRATRMYPVTLGIPKQLIPVNDQPVIRHSMSTLMLCGVKDFMIVTSPEFQPNFKSLIGDGSDLGVRVQFRAQARPLGVVDALLTAKDFIEGENMVAVMLGDNLFFGSGAGRAIPDLVSSQGATVFLKEMANTSEFGRADLSESGEILHIKEKIATKESGLAITGLYFFDSRLLSKATNVSRSVRNELEIVDILQSYLDEGLLFAQKLERGTTWIDVGSFDSLNQATHLVRNFEERHGLKIGCPEEIAWRMGFIDDAQLAKLARPLKASGYGNYLLNLLETEKLEFL